MKSCVFRIAGCVFILIGVAMVLEGVGITGFVINEGIGSRISSVLGLAFLIGGSVLFITKEEWWDRYRVGLTIKEYESGNINPVEAALKINDRLFPSGIEITGVDYRGGTSETIRTEKVHIPVRVNDKRKAKDLAFALYEISLINDRSNISNSEIHLSREASTKHHKKGFEKEIGKFENRYRQELSRARAK